jgi:hypothetical protein
MFALNVWSWTLASVGGLELLVLSMGNGLDRSWGERRGASQDAAVRWGAAREGDM